MTVLVCLTVGVLVAGFGGYGGESNGNTQEGYASMEKETLVTKLQQVGLPLGASHSHAWFPQLP